jgi:hypothetical protein
VTKEVTATLGAATAVVMNLGAVPGAATGGSLTDYPSAATPATTSLNYGAWGASERKVTLDDQFQGSVVVGE